MIEDAIGWLLELGDRYGVNPVVYAVIYVGAAPFFFGSLAWLVRSLRRRTGWALPLGSAAFFFSAPTLYVILAARNLPWWVYALLLVFAAIGAVATVRRVRRDLQSAGRSR